MRIANNLMAMNTHRQYVMNNDRVQASAEKLSSGYRINRAGDDAAGLAISEKMRSQIRGLNMASKNSSDAVSLIQTAEGALQEVHSMLQRMNELAVQSATGTNEGFDRTQIAKEFEQLKREINDISEQTTFNNMKLLDGSLSAKGLQRSEYTSGVYKSFEALDPNTEAGPLKNVVLNEGQKYNKKEGAQVGIDLSGVTLESTGGTVTMVVTAGTTLVTVAVDFKDVSTDTTKAAGFEYDAKAIAAEVAKKLNSLAEDNRSLNLNGTGTDAFKAEVTGSDGTMVTLKGQGSILATADDAAKVKYTIEGLTKGNETTAKAVDAANVKGSTHEAATKATSQFQFIADDAESGDSFTIGNNKFIFVNSDKDTALETNDHAAQEAAWLAVKGDVGGKVYRIDLAKVRTAAQLKDALDSGVGEADGKIAYATTGTSAATKDNVSIEVLSSNTLKFTYNGIAGTKVNSNIPAATGAVNGTDSFGSQGTEHVKVDSTPVNKSGRGEMTFELDLQKMKYGDQINWLKDDGSTWVPATYEQGDTVKSIMAKLGIEDGKNNTKVDGNSWTVTTKDAKIEAARLTFKAVTDYKEGTYEPMKIQVGALEGDQLSIKISAMNTKGLGLDDSSIYTQDTAGKAVTATRSAINQVSDQRALLGAMQNRMTHKIANLKVSVENLQASESRIRDIDIASEMTTFTKNNILSQAATSMLAQANSAPQNVLSLLK